VYCPLKYAAKMGDYWCEKENCAWWNSAEQKCSIALLGDAAIVNLIEHDERRERD
jgi:hypothetical protein